MGDSNSYQPAYEVTPHVLTLARDPDAEAVVCEPLFADGSGMVLHNLLSPRECDEIIARAAEFGRMETVFSRIRKCTRVVAMGPDLAALMFERARPFLRTLDVSPTAKQEQGIPSDVHAGLYEPTGLNTCFRIVRYEPGGHFLPHFDGGYDPSANYRSIKTFMIYLNDGFQGGPTNFYTDEQAHYATADPTNMTTSFVPKRGSCVAFNHHITHDGGMLLDGEKWLLRSEVMYARRERPPALA